MLHFLLTNLESFASFSHKKREYSLKTRAMLLIILLELEISAVAVQSIHKNTEKW